MDLEYRNGILSRGKLKIVVFARSDSSIENLA